MSSDTGANPSVWASRNGHNEIVEMLLERGAEINARGIRNGDSLQAACSEEIDTIVQMLSEDGTDLVCK
jgi:ankyrin repeat protein